MKKKSRKIRLFVCIPICIMVALVVSIHIWWLIGPISVQYSKKLTAAIRESDYQTVDQIIQDHPEAMNTQPTNTPLFIRKMWDVPSVMYPLQVACRVGDYKIVEQLLNAGADVNIRDDLLHDTPIIVCFTFATEDKYRIAELLLDRGADPTLHRTNNGTYDAIEQCIGTMVCDTEEQRAEGVGMRFLNRMLDMVDMETYDPLPLFRASIYEGGNVEALKCILERFDIPKEVQKKQVVGGKNVYDFAVEKGYTEIAELLK